ARNQKHFYFVSRPRRFGKSLFISTLKAIFSGKKELFNEYWIGKNSSYDWPKHPVIHLDFGGIAHKTATDLMQSLYNTINEVATDHGIILPYLTVEDGLKFLVKELSKINKVVLLIDEYDKPMVDHIGNLPIAEDNREVLNSFYTTVKSLEVYWRAIFITGVSKFTKTSLFSGLNNLQEISMDPIAAELFGYTHEELITYFPTYIDSLAEHLGITRQATLDSMKEWYDGYR
ncbi:MAG: AAA family ATPase, partial [Candidatus Dependentiae bacterium]|nr:AAA family ATPase [Candidatus Dependentiae bacterium]